MIKRLFLILSILLLSTGIAGATVGWNKSIPASTENPTAISADVIENNTALDLVLSNYRNGCACSYSSGSALTVGTGEVVVSNSAGTVRVLVANTSTTNVTSANIDTGAIANSTTYYIYAYAAATTSTTFSVVFSTSATTPTGITYYKRLGTFSTDASGNFYEITNDNSPVRAYDSGWFSVAVNTSYSKTHNLGTTKIIVKVYYSASSDGSNAMEFNSVSSSATNIGCQVQQITPTTLVVKTGYTKVAQLWTTGAWTDYDTGYYRVIAVAEE